MVKLECVTEPCKVSEIQTALLKIGIYAINITETVGCNNGQKELRTYRGIQESHFKLINLVNVQIVVSDKAADDVIAAVLTAVKKQGNANGHIYISPVLDFVNIKDGARGETALIHSESPRVFAHVGVRSD